MAWSAPKITQFSIARVTENDDLAIDGIYARASISASVSSLMVNGAEENTLTYFVQYRETGTSEWTDTDSIAATDTSVTQTWQLKNSGA